MTRASRIGCKNTNFILNTSIASQPHYNVVYEQDNRYYVFLMGEKLDVTDRKDDFIINKKEKNICL